MTSQVFPANQLTDLTATIFKAVGCNDNEADVIAKRLVNANLSGHDSHGIIRIAKYVDWIEQGGAVINQEIDILTDNGSVVVVDGKWGMGQSIGEQTMNLAIERAREHGVAVVALRNSGHLGRIGFGNNRNFGPVNRGLNFKRTVGDLCLGQTDFGQDGFETHSKTPFF